MKCEGCGGEFEKLEVGTFNNGEEVIAEVHLCKTCVKSVSKALVALASQYGSLRERKLAEKMKEEQK